MKIRALQFGRRGRRQRGSAALEFALGSGVLLSMFAGTFQFGYTFYQYNALANAVNTGAQFAAMRKYDSASSTPTSAFSTAVKNVVVYGNPAGTGTPIVPGLTPSHVNLTVTFVNNVPSRMRVAINGYTINSVFTTTNCTNKPSFSYPYYGIYQPY